jgi:small subunit ribosomal protein S2
MEEVTGKIPEQAAEELNKTTNSSDKKDQKGEDYFADFDFENLKIDVQEMFKNGVHFGHQKARKNPKMKQYIFGTRNGINIIDLQKTAIRLEEAVAFIEKTVAEGGRILFVGTKKQAKGLVESAARRCDELFVVERWLGGTLTNFKVIAERTRFLRDGQKKIKNNEYSQYTKFEQMKIAEELEDLERKMGGIKEMNKLPAAMLVTGLIEDTLAVKEAKKMGVPIVALVDTNVNPEIVDFPIPSNEDAVSSLLLMLGHICKAVLTGKAKQKTIITTKEEK